ncbi:MAG: hypothetical protein ABIP50_02185 [Candidatus Saccharimonadales bacterium]
MPKPAIIVAGIVGAVVVIGGGTFLALNMMKPGANSSTSSTSSTSKVALVDPDGVYDFFSDPSVTKHPEKNAKFGNGQTFTFEYDGSKTNNDPYATLSYQLYYIQNDGKTQPIGGGNVVGKGSGTFTVSDKVYDSNTKDRNGFFELQGTYDTGLTDAGAINGKNVKLGMYPITFDYAE